MTDKTHGATSCEICCNEKPSKATTGHDCASALPQATVQLVAANSATGPDNPSKIQAHQRPNSRLPAHFLRLHYRAMAAVRGRSSGLPGSCISGLSARA